MTTYNPDIRRDDGVVSPEKLAMLKRVYEVICGEAGIPVGAKAERNDLAERLIQAVRIVDEEEVLLVFARNALAEYRKMNKSTAE